MMPDCKYLCRLNAYYDRELTEVENAELLVHIEQCPECKREMENLKEISLLLASSKFPDIPEETVLQIHYKIDSYVEEKNIKFSKILDAAALILFMVSAILLYNAEKNSKLMPPELTDWEKMAITLQTQSSEEEDAALKMGKSLVFEMQEER